MREPGVQGFRGEQMYSFKEVYIEEGSQAVVMAWEVRHGHHIAARCLIHRHKKSLQTSLASAEPRSTFNISSNGMPVPQT